MKSIQDYIVDGIELSFTIQQSMFETVTDDEVKLAIMQMEVDTVKTDTFYQAVVLIPRINNLVPVEYILKSE